MSDTNPSAVTSNAPTRSEKRIDFLDGLRGVATLPIIIVCGLAWVIARYLEPATKRLLDIRAPLYRRAVGQTPVDAPHNN